MLNDKRRNAFLVTWREDEAHEHWRSTVENVYTGEKCHFSDRNELMKFLWSSLFEEDPPAKMEDETEKDT